jgi:hypothetical protein
MIEDTPSLIKNSYVTGIKCIRAICAHTGVLKKLDEKAKQSKNGHYIRSLLATHQLEDMVELDVPWWTYSSIEEINKLISKDNNLEAFEYGSGASTIWLAKRGVKITAIEHDFAWHEKLKSLSGEYKNIELNYVPSLLSSNVNGIYSTKHKGFDFSNYVNSIHNYKQKFDIISIDGRCRVACFFEALKHLKTDGFIIFDNSNRQRYDLALNNQKVNVQRFTGKVPGSPFNSETSIVRITN